MEYRYSIYSGSADSGQPGNGLTYFPGDFARRGAQFAQHGIGDAALFGKHRSQQVLRFNLLVVVL